MGTLPCGLSTKPGIVCQSDSLWLDNYKQGVEHTTTVYLVCRSDSLSLASHTQGLYCESSSRTPLTWEITVWLSAQPSILDLSIGQSLSRQPLTGNIAVSWTHNQAYLICQSDSV